MTTLDRLQSARKKDNSSGSPLERGPSTHRVLPQCIFRKPRGRITFWIVSFGITLSFAIIGFGMYWVGIHAGSEASTSSRPLLLSKDPPNSVEPQNPAHSFPATKDTPVPTSDFSNIIYKEALATNQKLDSNLSTRTPEIGTISLSKPDRLTRQGTLPHVGANSPGIHATSSTHVDGKQQQESLRSTTTPQVITNNISTPFAASPVTLKESLTPSPSARKRHREIVRLDKETIQTGKHVPNTDPTSKTRSSASPEVRLAQGQSLVKQHRYLKAVETLGQLFVSPPEEWEPWFWMGTAHMGLGHYEEAREWFREGLARDETIPQLWVQWAIVQHQRGKFSQSLDALRQAELLAPRLPKVQLNLAYALENQGHTRSALEHYRQYLSLTDHNPLHFSTRKKVLDRILHLEKS